VKDMEIGPAVMLNTLAHEAAAVHAARVKAHGPDYGEDVRVRVEAAHFLPGHWYVKAQRMRTTLVRNIEAHIGAIRKLEWQNFGINFVMVFSPNTFRGAPVSHIATLSWPQGADNGTELGLFKAMADNFPAITTVRVKDALESFARLAAQLALAIRGAASIALAASVLVLAGALAAGHRSRLYDAVVLKVLGATRRRILLAFVLEYGLLGLATALFGVAAGTACAWLIVTTLMDFTFTFLPGPALIAAFGAMVLTIAFGLIGTWRILGQKPAAHLGSL